MKFRQVLFTVIIILISSVYGMASTTIPMKLNVSAVLRYSDGTEINTISPETIKIGLYLSEDEFVWRKNFSVTITNGLIEAVLLGTGSDSNGDSVVLNESLFEHENLKVGFTIVEDGVEKLALVALTSQPYAIKSAIADFANLADNTLKLQGEPISENSPENKNTLVYVDGEWKATYLDNTMLDIDKYQLPTNDVTEISGTLENLKVKKLLGKKITTAVTNGSQIPTGAILMFSPDVDAPNGAFHPSSGNPDPGEFLAWDHVNDVWMPTINILSRLKDVVPPISDDGDAPSNNVLVYDFELNKYRSMSISLDFLNGVEINNLEDGSFLTYNGEKWESKKLSMNDIGNFNVTDISAGKYLYYDGTNWDAKSIRLQDLADLDGGIGEGKIIIGSPGAQRFEYRNFSIESLNDVDATNKETGYVLMWDGYNWTTGKNKIETINELDEFNISNSPSGKYLYHDGVNWVDQTLSLVEKTSDLEDMSFGTLAVGDFIIYNGEKWVNGKPTFENLDSIELDFTGQSLENPTKKFLVFKDGKWRNTTLDVSELTGLSLGDSQTGEFLQYNGSTWEGANISLGTLTNVNPAQRADGTGLQNGDILELQNGVWVVNKNELKDMTDVSTANIGANRILRMNPAGTGFVYDDYKMESLMDVNISNQATGKYLYFDGSEWVDQEISFVTSMVELTDVSLETVADKDLLIYDEGSGKWNPGKLNFEDFDTIDFDFTGQSSENPTKKFFAFKDGKWRNTTIDISEITGLSLDDTQTGEFLKYNGTTWQGANISLATLTNVNPAQRADGGSVENGDVLEFQNGVWVANPNELKDMTDITTANIGANRILKMNPAGTGFVYEDYKMDVLMDVNISDDATGKYLYYDGNKWVDQQITFVTSIPELTDVSLGVLSDNEFLKYDADTDKWVNGTFNFEDLDLVELDFTGQSSENPTKKFFVFKDGKWRNETVDISELTGLSIDDSQSGEFLRYNGTTWQGSDISLGTLTNVSPSQRNDGTNLQNGDVLEFQNGVWVANPNQLKDMTDITTANIGANRILKMNPAGTGFVYDDYKMDALMDVDISDEATGKYLYYDGSKWVDREIGFTTSVDQLSNVQMGVLNDNHLLKYDSDKEKWVNGTLDIDNMDSVELDFSGQSAVNPSKKFLIFKDGKWRNDTIDFTELTGLSINSPSTGNVLLYNGATWVSQAPLSQLSQLSGVSISGIQDGHILKYNSTTGEWENQPEATTAALSTLESSGVDEEIDVEGSLIPAGTRTLGKENKYWSSVYTESFYLRSTGMYFGESDNYAQIAYDQDNREIVIKHFGSNGVETGADLDLRLRNGLALAGDSWEVATENIHAIAFWDGQKGNKISQDFPQLSYNSQTNSVGFGVGEPNAKVHIQMSEDSNQAGIRMSGMNDSNSYMNIYQAKLPYGAKTPYLFHSEVNDGTSNFHDIGFKIGSEDSLYMAIQHATHNGAGGYSTIDDVFVGIGTTDPLNKLDVRGKVRATSMFLGDVSDMPTTNTNVKLHVGGDAAVDGAIYISGGSDLAEGFHIVADQDVEPGTVVSIDPKNIGKLVVSDEAFDTKVAGVVSGGNGIKAGLVMTQTGTLADGEYPIALTGRVWVKCTNENGDIGIGDLLTTSSKPGHSMKATGDKIHGAILGKAMSTCGDNSMVLTLISLQ